MTSRLVGETLLQSTTSALPMLTVEYIRRKLMIMLLPAPALTAPYPRLLMRRILSASSSSSVVMAPPSPQLMCFELWKLKLEAWAMLPATRPR